MFQGLFSLVDLFGTPVIINFSGKEKVKTRFGAICSALFFGFVIWVVYDASKAMFQRTSPNSVSSQTYHQNPREMNISSANFPIAFSVLAPDALGNIPFIDDSIFTMSLVHKSYQVVKLSNGTYQQTFTNTSLVLERCKTEYFGSLAFAFENLDINTLICISPNQPNLNEVRLQGTYVSPIYESMTLNLYQCNSSTSCADSDVITQYLEGATFNMVYADMVIDPNNYTYPDARYQEIYTKSLSETSTKLPNVQLSHLQVITDSGWLGTVLSTKEYVKVYKIAENSQTRTQGDTDVALLSCTFEVSKLENNYSRSYKKFLTVLAEVASLANTVLVVLVIVTTPYLKLRFREILMNQFFDINMNPMNKRYLRKQRSIQHKLNINEIDALNNSKSEVQQTEGDIQTNRKVSYDYLGEISPKIDIARDKEAGKARKSHRLKIPQSYNALTDYERTKIDSKEKNEKSSVFPKVNSWVEQYEFETIKNDSSDSPQSYKLSKQSSKETKMKASQFKVALFSTKEEATKLPKKELEDDLEKECPEQSLTLQEDQHLEENKNQILIEQSPSPTTGEKENVEDNTNYLQLQVENIQNDQNEKINPGSNKNNKSPRDNSNKPPIVKLTVWEYVLSLVWKPKFLRDKLEILETGRQNIGERLDVINILQKMREIDKMRALLFDKDQLVLFNSLPKPELTLRRARRMRKSFSVELLKETRITNENGEIDPDQVQEAYEKIKCKEEKTELDKRLLEVFSETLREIYAC